MRNPQCPNCAAPWVGVAGVSLQEQLKQASIAMDKAMANIDGGDEEPVPPRGEKEDFDERDIIEVSSDASEAMASITGGELGDDDARGPWDREDASPPAPGAAFSRRKMKKRGGQKHR